MENSNENKTYRLVIAEWLTLAGVFLGCFYLLYSEMKSIDCRIEQRVISQEQRMLSQEQRTDRLYEMFIELVKEKKEIKL